MEQFWTTLWDHAEIVGERGAAFLVDGEKMPGARFFPGARLSFAENMLRERGEHDAIVFRGEDKAQMRMSWDELHAMVSQLQQGFAQAGIRAGDRIAAMAPNRPETIACMLATNSLGAVWSSCSPDFGEQGVMDRFGQIEPKLFIACDGYWYNGKEINVAEKVSAISAKLGATKTIVMDYLGRADETVSNCPNGVTLARFIEPHEARPVTFEKLSFDHPLYILFS